MTLLRTLLALLLAALAIPAAAAPHATVTLAAESATPAPGKPLTLALTFAPQPGWHTYWQNPGDAGFATRATWTLPTQAAAGALLYPVPTALLLNGAMNYVYEAPATLLVDVAVPAGASGSFPVAVKLDYLVCSSEMCVPETATVSRTLTVGDGAPDPGASGTFAAARAALPVPLAAKASYSVAGGRFALMVPFAGPARVRNAYFFPLADGAASYAAAQVVTVAGDALRIETKADGTPAGPVAGVLRVEREGEAPRGFAVTADPGTVPAAGPPLAARDEGGGIGFWPALLLAVAGGIVLNIMPCVFPILSLKALSLAKSGADEGVARRDALAYAGGVIAVCVGLGALILALRAAGTQVGWAFQLQSPQVILGLLLLTTAIAFNLAGLFELGTIGGGDALASKPGAAGSFWTGALAAFIATPCTGPFMAGALGAALVLPPVAGLAVFAGLGLGLALPFLAIGFVPALRRRLPKPGAWMATFRRVLSVPMFVTALGLAWILGQQTGTDGMVLGLAGALALGLLLWWLGARQANGRNAWEPIGAAVAAVILTIANVQPAGHASARAETAAIPAAEPFSEVRLTELTRAGTPTFVYFTADWCLTCKVNEHGALADPAVAAAFRKAGVRTLVGDWTSGDAAISRFLSAQGAAGVPLYLFYSKAGGAPAQLPQILSTEDLVGAANA